MEGLVERDLGDGLGRRLRGAVATPRLRRRAAAAAAVAPSRPIPARMSSNVDRRRSAAGRGPGRRGPSAAAPRRRTCGRSRRTRRRRRSAELVADVAALAAAARAAEAREPATDRAPRRRAPARLNCLPVRPERVVLLALVRVGQDRVGLVDLLEPRSAALSPGLASGWCSRASLRKAFLISAWTRSSGRRGPRSSPCISTLGAPSRPPLRCSARHGEHVRTACAAITVPRTTTGGWSAAGTSVRRTASAWLALRLRLDGVVALDDLRRLGGERLRLAPEGRLEHLVHRVHEDELDRLADLVRDVPQVLLVLARQDDDLARPTGARPGSCSSARRSAGPDRGG